MTAMAASTNPLRVIAQPAGSCRAYLVAVLVIMTLLAALWSLVARRQLDRALAASTADNLDRAHALFDVLRSRTRASLRSQCGVLVEDPRLKSTLSTEGIDEATVADILADLGRLRGTGFLLVLTPEGRVFAEAGADELRGLDLSESSVVKKARGARDEVVGSWVIGGKIIDLAVTAIQFNRTALAYLVLGQAVDAELVKAVSAGTGSAVAVIAGVEASPVSTTDDKLRTVFQTLVHDGGVARAHAVEIDGAGYLTATVEIEDTGQSHPRLAVVRPLVAEQKSFEIFEWLLLAPIALVVVGVALAGQRFSYRTSRTGRTDVSL
jgi:hypothetical protein